MEFVVKRSAEECIFAAETFFRLNWPYRGTVRREENLVFFLEKEDGAKSFLERKSRRSTRLLFLPEGKERTRIVAAAGRLEYKELLERWLMERLGAKRVNGL